MSLISGWIGLLSALDPAGGSAVTEASGNGYVRQSVRFGPARSGVSKIATPYTFGNAKVGQTAGRAIWSAPTGGNLLLVLPYGSGARPQPGGGPTDAGDVGSITLTIASMVAYPDPEAFTGFIGLSGAGPTTIGTTYDATDEALAPWASTAGPGGVVPKAIVTAPLMAPIAGQLEVRAGNIAWENPQ